MPRLLKVLDSAHHHLDTLSKWLAAAAAGALLGMMALVNANVILRPMGIPIWGTYEMVGFLGSIVLSFALLHITLQRGHMAVEVLTSRCPEPVCLVLDLANRVIGIFVTSLIAWQSLVHGLRIMQSGEVSPTLRLPFYPLLFGITFAFGAVALALVIDVIRHPLSGQGDA